MWNIFHFYEKLLYLLDRDLDHLAVYNLAQGARLLGGATGYFIYYYYICDYIIIRISHLFQIVLVLNYKFNILLVLVA